MFEIGFSLTSDNYRAYWWVNVIRQVLSMLDRAVYNLIVVAYIILFNIAETKIFSSDMISEFYERVQLIIGVFMIFKLAVSLLKTVINPDTLTDKESGFGKIITRIVIMLAMFVAIKPLNIPATEGTYNAYLNESGLLFGTMYYFQAKVLDNNVLGKLIIGKTNSSSESEESSDNLKTNQSGVNAAEAGKNLAAYVLKGFVRINLKEEDTESNKEVDENDVSNYMCPVDEIDSGDDDVYDVYNSLTVSPNQILDRINAACNTGGVWVIDFDGPSRYALSYMPLVSTAVGILVLLMLVSYCVEVAIRAIKLAILRLLAPIPIISYVDPKSEKGGAFSSWTKILATTYADLFIRLSIIYFIISLISQIVGGSLNLPIANGAIGAISTIFIIIGLFNFAKDAPKFIKDALGIKSEGGAGLFSGLGKITGIGTAIAGGIGSARTNYKASKEENGAGGAATLKNVGSGLIGGISGTATGVKAASTAKDHKSDAAMKAMEQRNSLRASHSTATGRIADRAVGLFGGQSLAAKDQATLDDNKAAADAIKSYKTMLQEEAKKKGNLGYTTGNVRTTDGVSQPRAFNYEKLLAAMNTKDNNGNFKYGGLEYNAGDFDQNLLDEILDSQTTRYMKGDTRTGQKAYADNDKIKTQRAMTEHAVKVAGGNVSSNYKTGEYDDLGSAIGAANTEVATMSTNMTNIKHRANYQANKNK